MQSYEVILRAKQLDQAAWANALWAADSYAQRMQEALRGLCQPDYPAGMIPWLGQAHPDLYDELTSRIPDEIDLAWKCRVPLADFDAILESLMEKHHQACELYRQHLKAGGKYEGRP